jgi:hypothetical protein
MSFPAETVLFGRTELTDAIKDERLRWQIIPTNVGGITVK